MADVIIIHVTINELATCSLESHGTGHLLAYLLPAAEIDIGSVSFADKTSADGGSDGASVQGNHYVTRAANCYRVKETPI